MAANRERGEYAVTVKGREYILRPTMNSMCEAEALTGLKTLEIIKQSYEGSFSANRALIWAYLQEYHGDTIKSLKDAGKWIDDAGGIDKVNEALEALEKVNGPDGDAKAGGAANPPDAQGGTGEASSLRLVESA